MRRLYFEVSQAYVRVLRMKSPSATFFHGTTDIPAENALEELGTVELSLLVRSGFIQASDLQTWDRINPSHLIRSQVLSRLDKLSEEQTEALVALLRARQSGFDTKFLQDLDEVK